VTATLTLIPGATGLDQLCAIYRQDVSIRIDPACKERVDAAAAIVAAAADGEAAVYGINTGWFSPTVSEHFPL